MIKSFLLGLFLLCATTLDSAKSYVTELQNHTYALYAYDNLTIWPSCTAWRIAKDYVATAAHCVRPNVEYMIAQNTNFPMRTVEYVGMNAEHDFAIFRSKTESKKFLKITNKVPKVGDEILVAGFPHMERESVLYGRVSALTEDGYLELQLPGAAPGVSGAAVYCVKQEAVCGMVVGYDPSIPSRFYAEPSSHWGIKDAS